jgi:hypothetical protein
MENLIFLEPRSTFDTMILGVSDKGLVYDQDALIEHWKKEFSDSATDEDEAHIMAVEWFEFNVLGAYYGEYTPIYSSKESLELVLEDI